MKNVVCFDVGGTFIKFAVINEEGKILFKNKFPTPSYDCKVTIPENMIEKIEQLQRQFEIHSVGICTAGVVDSKSGIVLTASNFKDYDGARLSEYIKKRVHLQVYVENDVNAIALGELWMGAAKGHDTFVCIALGTGVGGSIVIDGKVVKGISGGAGEIGHIIVNEKGEQCGCGAVGCYERYASTSALIRNYRKKAEKQGIKIEEINGESILKRVAEGETLAKEVYDEFLEHVATGIVSITHLLDPGLIVLGGGISAQGEDFIKKLNDKFQKKAMKEYADHTKIVQAELKNDAGIYGACYSALYH